MNFYHLFVLIRNEEHRGRFLVLIIGGIPMNTKSMFCLVVVACCFFGCGKSIKSIPDTNGMDDYSLTVLGENELCAEFNESYSLITPTLKVTGDKSFADEGVNDHHDGDYVMAQSLSPVSGVNITQTTFGKTDTVVFTVTSTVTEGNARVYLYCYETETIWHDFLINGTESFTATGCMGKEFDIRVAGESAMYLVEITREFID